MGLEKIAAHHMPPVNYPVLICHRGTFYIATFSDDGRGNRAFLAGNTGGISHVTEWREVYWMDLPNDPTQE